MRKITPINIDTYICDRNRQGSKFIRWNKKEWKILTNFVMAATSPLFSDGKNGYKIKNGDTFMGVKHFKLKV